MRQSTLLILNTAATYLRMLLTVGIGLVVTRLILKALGEEEYGLLLALGAGGSFLTFVTSALTQSSIRHLAHRIGAGDQVGLHRFFSATVMVYVVLALAIGLTAAAIGPFLLATLTIPEGRETAALWVYVVSVTSVVLTVTTTPYRSLISAHQAIISLAVFELISRVMLLGLVVGLIYMSWDTLVGYALIQMSLAILFSFLVVGFCMVRYSESRPPFTKPAKEEFKELGSFAGWMVFSKMAVQFRSQLTLILLNIFFGGATSAAYGIAMQMQGYVGQLTGVILKAADPAMTTLEAKGLQQSVRQMALFSSKYTALLAWMVLIPICLETEAILALWLGDYPTWAPFFARFLIAGTALGSMTYGHMMAMQARGEIKIITLIISLPSMTVVCASAILVATTDCGPWVFVVFGLLITIVATVWGRQAYTGPIIGLPTRVWLSQVVLKICLVVTPALIVTLAIRFGMSSSLWRVGAITLLSPLIILPLCWLVALDSDEKNHFRRVFGLARRRLMPSSSS